MNTDKLMDALIIACRHIDMGKLMVSHKKDAETIAAALRAEQAVGDEQIARDEWTEATKISMHDDVDDVLRDFAADPTGDNGVMVVREVMRVLRALGTARQSEGVVPDGFYVASFKRPGSNWPGVLWWMPNNAGYSNDLEQAGIYTEIVPGYHDNEYTVPVPVSFINGLRVRRTVDPGDSLNHAFHSAKSLRAILAIAAAPGGEGEG